MLGPNFTSLSYWQNSSIDKIDHFGKSFSSLELPKVLPSLFKSWLLKKLTEE